MLPAALAGVAVLGAVGGPVTASAAPGSTSTVLQPAPAGPSGRYLVQYAAGADVTAEARSLRTQGVEVRRTYGRHVQSAVVSATRAEAARLARDPQVVVVEPDIAIRATTTQDNAPWGLDRVDQRALPLTASYTPPAAGEGVTVYVMDTGVLAEHRDFGHRVVDGWSAIADGRGTSDCNGHGTHVAGTVAGTYSGAAKQATIVPVRVLDCNGMGHGGGLIAGLEWIIDHHQAGTPAVLNMSLGGGATSLVVDSWVNAVMDDGVTAVVAAGNSAQDACATSPARVDDALTVAASDRYDFQARFSNFGPCVDLFAPGVGITSAWHSSTTARAKASGTSMATPHVAGTAAVLLSQQPLLSPAEVATRIEESATTYAISHVSAGTPNRLLHLAPAGVAQPQTGPGSPARAEAPKAGARRRAAVVRWSQAHDGGSRITEQVVRVYKGRTRVGALRVPGDVTRVLVRGLRPGKVYRFSVSQKNAVGPGPASAKSNKVRPRR